jgi:hypothetical protein
VQKSSIPDNQIQNTRDSSTDRTINHSLIELAMQRSPTGGNSKPFFWYWTGQVLHIRHDESLATHYLNRNHHTSWLALGCLLKSVEFAARCEGFQISYEIRKADLSTDVAFSCSPDVTSRPSDLQALLNRRTYRGPLVESEKPSLAINAETGAVRTHMVSSSEISSPMKKFLIKADSYLWLQKHATRDFFREIVFTRKEQTETDRGIRVMDLGIGKMDQLMLRFFSMMPWLPSLMVRIPVLNHSFRASTERTLKNAHLALITARSLEPLELFRTGQQAMQVWIEMEKQGYKVQPLSMASITLVDAATNSLPADTKKNFRQLFSFTGPEVLKEQFQLSAQEKPVWLLRIGRAQE